MKKLLLVLTTMVCLIGTIQSQTAGSFDNTFDGDGKRTITFGPGNDEFYDVEAQSDGKVVAVGASRVGTYYNFIIARFLPDGSYDPSFASVGYRQLVVNTGDEYFYGLDIADDGKIIAVGYTTVSSFKKVIVYRFNPDGSNDGTFGSGSGYVVTPISAQNSQAEDVTVLADKRIVITGEANGGSNLDFFVARYLETGELDNTFNGNGFLVFDVGNYDNYGYGIEKHIDGSYVIAGHTATASNFVIAKITSAGTLDASFNSSGIYSNHMSCNYNYGYDLVIQPDGKIIGAGYSQCGYNYLTMVRLSATGIPDPSFSGDGIVTHNLGSDNHFANDIKLQNDGKIVTCGYVLSGTYKFAVHRFLADGTPDATFGGTGSVITSLLNEDNAMALTIYDKWVYVVGKTFNGTNYDMFINKLWLCSVPVVTTNLSPSMNVCEGTNVELMVAATGTGLSYQWYFNGTPIGSGMSTLPLGLVTPANSGTYYCEITNDCGIATSSTMVLTVHPKPNVTTNVTNTTCFGTCFGYAEAVPTGGTPTYTFAWDDPGSQNSQMAMNLCPGIYNVTLVDMNGCSATASAMINQPTEISLSTSSTSASCNLLSDGTATVTPTGGTPPYSYSWLPSGTTSTITGLAAGTYNVTVGDANSCQKTTSVIVTEPAMLSAFLTKTDPLCVGACNGTATANPSGGTSPYGYTWATGGNAQTETGLCMGSANVTITDSHGCTTNAMTSIMNPPTLTVSLSQTNVLCNGSATGTASATPSGGTGSYTYLWTGGMVTQNVSGLAAGTYNCTVTDSNGCYTSSSVTITQPTPINISLANQMNPTCSGSCNGSININVAGGTPTYNYNWTGGSTLQDPVGLCAGTFFVTVIDANGCTASSSFTLVNPPAITANAGPNQTVCANNSNVTLTGSITVATGGVWSGGGGSFAPSSTALNAVYSPTAAEISAGTVTLTLTTTGNGSCSAANDQMTISITPAPTVTAGSDIGVCNGTTINLNGSVTIATGGTWSGGLGLYTPNNNTLNAVYTPTAGEISAGTVTLTLTTTGNGTCLAVADNVTISIFPSVTAAITPTSVLCNGTSTGAVNLTVSTGTPTYGFSWSNSASTEDLTNVLAGTYSVTITDSHGCTATASTVVTQPPVLTLSLISETDVTCNSAGNGQIVLSASGGAGPYQYSNNGGTTYQASGTFTGLAPDSYDPYVMDDNGCTVGLSPVIISEPTALSLTLSMTPEHCGLADGTATAVVTGGTMPYNYLWNDVPPQTAPTANGLAAGTYTADITDNNGCFISDAITVTSVSGPSVTITSTTDVYCAGSNTGSITATVTGGTGTIYYLWNDITSQSTATATNLFAGTYTVTVTDDNGCTNSASASVLESGTPLSLTLVSQTNATCFGDCNGEISISVSGGTPSYNYYWSTGANVPDVTGLCAGNHSVTVYDSNSCSVSASYTITEPAELTVSLTPTMIICFGACDGAIISVVSGGTGTMDYLWNEGSTSSDVTGLCAGTYTITVTDDNGCTAFNSVVITEPDQLIAIITSSTDETYSGACDGTASVSQTGGIGPFTYSWSNLETTADVTGLCAGAYNVTVVDAVGCIAPETVIILSGPETIIDGNVSYSTGVFNMSDVTVELYYDNGVSMEFLQAMNCGSGGIFGFSGLASEGDYYLRAFVNDEFLYPNIAVSYYDSAFVWAGAIAIPVTFGTTSTVLFKMFEITPPTATGPGDITGTIYYLSGAKDFGEPVPGAEIYLEQEPEGEPIACDETDVDGNYGFLDVEEGDYSLTVDIPGFPQVNTYDISVTSGDTLFNDMNFIVDTTAGGEYIDTTSQTVGISQVIANDFSIEVYPTLVDDQLNVSCVLRKDAAFALYLRDVTGKEMITPVTLKLNEGEYLYKLDEFVQPLTPGVYFLSVRIDNNVYLKKVVKK